MKATVSEVIKKINKEKIYNEYVNSYLTEKWCEDEEDEKFVKKEIKKHIDRFINKFKFKKYNKMREKLIPFESTIKFKNKLMYVCGMGCNKPHDLIVVFNMKRKERYYLHLDEFIEAINA